MIMIYLVDLAKYKLAFRLIRESVNKKNIYLVLIQDGVYINPSEFPVNRVYAMKPDVEERGVASRLLHWVKIIDYGELIDLMEKYKVKSFV